MKITLVVGSLFAVFLLLMVSNVNAVEYHQVSSDINKKISVLTGEIKRLRERVTEEHIVSLNKLAKNEKISNIFDEVTSKLGDICFSCLDGPGVPVCIVMFFNFYFYLFMSLLFMVTVILLPIAISFIS